MIRNSSHVSHDIASRRAKARKIEYLLRLGARRHPLELLDIGTGCGAIAHYFGTHLSLSCRVTSIDIRDCRNIRDGYSYVRGDGCVLPFTSGQFDVVISNHVIEHVGCRKNQLQHLREMKRVMKADGIGYLAVPNRWAILEPHYRLAFLSWLPRPWRSAYLRLCGRGHTYDCEPLGPWEARRLLRSAGFEAKNVCAEAALRTLEWEHVGSLWYNLARCIPRWILQEGSIVMPTLIYLLSPCTDAHSTE